MAVPYTTGVAPLERSTAAQDVSRVIGAIGKTAQAIPEAVKVRKAVKANEVEKEDIYGSVLDTINRLPDDKLQEAGLSKEVLRSRIPKVGAYKDPAAYMDATEAFISPLSPVLSKMLTAQGAAESISGIRGTQDIQKPLLEEGKKEKIRGEVAGFRESIGQPSPATPEQITQQEAGVSELSMPQLEAKMEQEKAQFGAEAGTDVMFGQPKTAQQQQQEFIGMSPEAQQYAATQGGVIGAQAAEEKTTESAAQARSLSQELDPDASLETFFQKLGGRNLDKQAIAELSKGFMAGITPWQKLQSDMTRARLDKSQSDKYASEYNMMNDNSTALNSNMIRVSKMVYDDNVKLDEIDGKIEMIDQRLADMKEESAPGKFDALPFIGPSEDEQKDAEAREDALDTKKSKLETEKRKLETNIVKNSEEALRYKTERDKSAQALSDYVETAGRSLRASTLKAKREVDRKAAAAPAKAAPKTEEDVRTALWTSFRKKFSDLNDDQISKKIDTSIAGLRQKGYIK